jgi:gamma-glutamyl-gamma-aminobutyrate hydrolase PuuD
MELPGARWVASVQWHAEALVDAPEQQRLFEQLVAAARDTPLRQAA